MSDDKHEHDSQGEELPAIVGGKKVRILHCTCGKPVGWVSSS